MRLVAYIRDPHGIETFEEWEYTGDLTESYLAGQISSRSASTISVYDDTYIEGQPQYHLFTYDPNAN
jgi:hypothetical protein